MLLCPCWLSREEPRHWSLPAYLPFTQPRWRTQDKYRLQGGFGAFASTQVLLPVLIWLQALITGPPGGPPVVEPFDVPVPSIWTATCEATPSPRFILVLAFVFAPETLVPMIGDA